MARRKMKMAGALRALVEDASGNVWDDGSDSTGAFDQAGDAANPSQPDSGSTIFGTDIATGAVQAPAGFTLADVGKLVQMGAQIYKLVQNSNGQLIAVRQQAAPNAGGSVGALLKNPLVLVLGAYLLFGG